MRSKWRETPLKDLAIINKGNYSRNDNWGYVNYLDTSNITKGVIGNITYLDLKYDKLPTRARRKVEINDIVYSMVRPNQEHYGIIRNPTSNMLVSTGFVTITTKDEIKAPYLYYFISQPQVTAYLQAIAEQRVSTYPALNVTDIGNLKVVVPPLPTQKAIADTLSCLDAKIEVNNEIIKNLEKQAQAIFKSWFIEFEPFQDGEFVESEFGPIPEGWKVGKLEEIAEITMGQSPKGSTYNEEGLGEVFFQGSSDFGWRFPTRRLFTTDPKRMASKGDVLMSVRAPVGAINLALEPCCIGRGLASIRNTTYPSFLLYTMYAIHERLAQFNAEGTVFGSINQGALKSLLIITPPKNIMLQFEKTVKANDEIIWVLSEQNTTLAALRDTLLPKLMSGEIEVPVEQV